jgi:glutathione S-transferase
LSDWYLAFNPNGVVPALVHDGRTILNSSVIRENLEDVFPNRPLRPRDPVEVAHIRAWRQFIDEVPTVAIRYPSFNAAFVHNWTDMSAACLQMNKALRRCLSLIFLSACRRGFAY